MVLKSIGIMPSPGQRVSNGQQFPLQGTDHLMVETSTLVLTRKVRFTQGIRQFQVGIKVPSITSEPGTFRLTF